MCHRCVEAQARMEEYDERIDQLVKDAKNVLDGIYTGDVMEAMGDDKFDDGRPFIEKLFQLSSAIAMLTSAQAVIEGRLPSEIHVENMMLAREAEVASGLGGGIRAVAIPVGRDGGAEALLSALFGMTPRRDEDDEPTTLH